MQIKKHAFAVAVARALTVPVLSLGLLAGAGAAHATVTEVYSFVDELGITPEAALTLGQDGNFYGTASSGGPAGYGTIFKVSTTGKISAVASFDGSNGATPRGDLIQGADGSWYGTTEFGGEFNGGTVFKLSTDGTLSVLASLPANSVPYAGLVFGGDGNLYGTTYVGGAAGKGTLFRVTLSGQLTTLFEFSGNDGANPVAALTVGADGKLYGTTYQGGTANYGTLFSLSLDGSFSKLVDFTGDNGSNPRGALTLNTNGELYGTTVSSTARASKFGEIFKYTPADGLKIVVRFNRDNEFGRAPGGRLALADDGGFYGTTHAGISLSDGTHTSGSVFKLSRNGRLTTLTTFTSLLTTPAAGVVLGPDNAVYGTTSDGGINYGGSVFRVSQSTGISTTIASLGLFPQGAFPPSALLKGADGALYGTTGSGGAAYGGTLFKYSPTASLSTIINFAGPNGAYPVGSLSLGSDGAIYGVTQSGGTGDAAGTVYKLLPSGVSSTVVGLTTATAGQLVESGVTPLADGTLFGTACYGGAYGYGTVYSVLPGSGSASIVHSFDLLNDGQCPQFRPIPDADGFLYGTTSSGGINSLGTVYRMSTDGTVSLLAALNSTTGFNIGAELATGTDGSLYTVAESGGSSAYGTVLKISLDGTQTALLNFDGFAAGLPYGQLAPAAGGGFYGTAVIGGDYGVGSIYYIGEDGTFLVLDSLTLDQASSANGLTAAGDDAYYGSTSYGGQSGVGSLFKWQP